MANEGQLSILRQGVEVWNKWRDKHRDRKIDLEGADLSGANLREADLNDANLREVSLNEANLTRAFLNRANLSKAHLVRTDFTKASFAMTALTQADLREANLRGANFYEAKLMGADLRKADLREAAFHRANLLGANLSGANLSGANLMQAHLNSVNLTGANLHGASLLLASLTGANLRGSDLRESNLSNSNLVAADITDAKISKSQVYGVNIWDLKGKFKEQRDLVITPADVAPITVDNIKVAQLIYLILNNEEIREVINMLTSRAVLILGRFAIPERKAILDALRNKLREYNLLPIVFDFDRPTDKDFTETIKTLAGISYFVIADVTNPKSSPLELQAIVPDYQIPFVPIIQEGESPFAMMVDLQKKYNWILPTRSYDSIETLMAALKPGIIDPAVEMKNKLRLVKAQAQVTESLKDYLGKSL